MKHTIILLVISALILCSCQNKSANRIFHPESLASEKVSFDITKDTNFKTKHGTIVRIPAGSLQSTGSPIVELEIKEASNVGEMIRAGLAMQSNGEPLVSGGLIYIDALGDEKVRISKPFMVAVPTNVIDDSMRLFNGELDDDSNMNWVSPKVMADNPQWKAMQNGKSLFISNCASCHGMNKSSVGPELAHIVKRTSKPVPFGEQGYVQNGHNLLYDFTRNNQAVLKWSLYYRCLYNQYNKSPMNLFPDLTETDLNNIYSYIENESEVKKLPVPDNGIENCLDSCLLYAEAKIRLKQMKGGFESDSVREPEDNFIFNASSRDTSMNKRILVTHSIPNYLADLEVVDPIRKKPLYYQFNIDAFGWHNIGKLLSADYGTQESLLLAKIKGGYNEKLNVFLVIPSMKVVAAGNILDKDKNTYGFYSKDGTVILPQNVTAFLVALQEKKDSVIFAKKEFITSSAQYFDVELNAMKKSSLTKEMNLASPASSSIQVKDTRSASAIRRSLKDVQDAEELKPKNCDCSCFTIQPVDADARASKEVSASKPIESVDSTKVKPSGLTKESISTKTPLKAEPKKETSKSTSTSSKKTTSSKKKSNPTKKKSTYKGRLAKR